MKTRALLRTYATAALLLGSAGCGKPPPPPPDAGVDDSCGLDCVAQHRYGLILKRCFEYTDTTVAQDLPSLGVYVSEKRELEGGVPVISVDYSQSGARKMTDSFTIREGRLILARREWTSGGSVTYKDAAGNIVGVDFLHPDTAAGQNFATTATADYVTPNGTRQSDDTSFTVVASAPTNAEKTNPSGTYEGAVKLLINEQPPHGMDTRRIFSDGTGFILIATTLTATGGTNTPFALQRIRDLGTPDGGDTACGLTP